MKSSFFALSIALFGCSAFGMNSKASADAELFFNCYFSDKKKSPQQKFCNQFFSKKNTQSMYSNEKNNPDPKS